MSAPDDTPNWYEPLRRAARENGVPLTEAISVANIVHDDPTCARIVGTGVCDCDPDVLLFSRRVRPERGGRP